MQLVHSIVSWYMKQRLTELEQFKNAPTEKQTATLHYLVNCGKETIYGEGFSFKTIKNEADYKAQVPIVEYDNLKPYIDKILTGKQNVLWNSPIKWLAKSSGTTNDKSKYIPVSKETLNDCHYKAARDVLAVYCYNNPESQLFTGKGIILGGSHTVHQLDRNIKAGDLSAVLLQNMSQLGRYLSSIDLEISLLNEWEQKIDKLADYYIPQRVTNILGVPSWMLVFFKHVLEKTGKNTINQVWEHLELYIHGGVSFIPYVKQFEQTIGKKINYLQTYNASEGFFALQDLPNANDMLLMLDLGIYYEFMPLEELTADKPKTLNLNEVELHTNYALIISTQSGLWRYQLGDTIKFTSLKPHRIIITGRTKHFINVFGEELMIDNADKALKLTCEATNCTIVDYTVAPIFMSENKNNGGHEWAIEFDNSPISLSDFIEVLDDNLKTINSDYEAKRYKNFILQPPVIQQLKQGCFYQWLKQKGKLGGQNKVPRLSNSRKHIKAILEVDKQL